MSPTTETLAIVLVFSVPILAILSGFARQWLTVRTQQRALGASNQELEQKVERLERINGEYAQRIENLEAIVVSQTWNAIQDSALSEADRQRRIAATVRHEVRAPAAEEMNRQRAADLARRVGG
jgi:hypothetical protein